MTCKNMTDLHHKNVASQIKFPDSLQANIQIVKIRKGVIHTFLLVDTSITFHSNLQKLRSLNLNIWKLFFYFSEPTEMQKVLQ